MRCIIHSLILKFLMLTKFNVWRENEKISRPINSSFNIVDFK